MTPAALRSQYADLYGSSQLPVLEMLFRSELEMHPSKREALFNVRRTDRDIWQYSELLDLELFKTVAEGSEFSFVAPKEGSSKTLTISKQGLGFSISEEMVADAKFDAMADMTRKLAKSAKETQEISAMNILNNGFTTETTADGVSLFNATHPLPSGGSYRNQLSVAADLSTTSLNTALSDYETQFVGDSGIIYSLRPDVLLVHPSQKRYAKELTQSELKADTDNNNMNSFRDDGLIVMSSPHLTDTDAWYLLKSPGSMDQNGLVIAMREGIQSKAAGPDVGFKSDSIYFKSRYREAIAAVHGYGSFATPGA